MTTAQHTARKTLKHRYYPEFRKIVAALQETYKHEINEYSTAQEKRNWYSRVDQRAIRQLCTTYYNEYRREYRKARELGLPSNYPKKGKTNEN